MPIEFGMNIGNSDFKFGKGNSAGLKDFDDSIDEELEAEWLDILSFSPLGLELLL